MVRALKSGVNTARQSRAAAHYLPVGEWWFLNAAILDAIQADCRQAKMPLLFVYIPTQRWHEFRALRAYMKRTGANFVDLSEGGRNFAADMYLPADEHLNAKGNRYIAEAVLAWIRANLPERRPDGR